MYFYNIYISNYCKKSIYPPRRILKNANKKKYNINNFYYLYYILVYIFN